MDQFLGGRSSADALSLALHLAEYLEAHALRIYGQAIAPDLSGAHALTERIQRGELGDPIRARDVQRKGWSGLSTPEAVQSGLDRLVELGWLRQQREQQTGGRPATVYRINPKVRTDKTDKAAKSVRLCDSATGIAP